MKTTTTIEETIKTLNRLLELDPLAMRDLVEHRVLCTTAMATHPGVPSRDSMIGMMGIINALFDTDLEGNPPIAARFDSANMIEAFIKNPSFKG